MKFRFLVLLVGLVLACLPFSASAQEGPGFLVVLDVPGGGTEELMAGLKELEGVRVEGQKWFLEEVQARGMTPRRILRRPKDMRWVMRGAEITYVIFLEKGDSGFAANFVGESGESEEKVELEGEALDASGVEKIVALAREKLAKSKATDVAAVEDEPLPEPEVKPRAPAPPITSSSWLDIGVGLRLLKRDLVIGGKNGGVLTYPSQLYPGAQILVEGYPGGASDAIGFYLRGIVGLGSVATAGVSSGVLHIDAEGGPSYRVKTRIGAETSSKAIETTLRGGARFTSFSTDALVLPATSMVALTLGATTRVPALDDAFAVRGTVDFTPFGLWLEGRDKFGESSITYGFSASLGGIYAITSSIDLAFDYWMRLDRTTFSGVGTLGFDGADGLELVQGLHAGVILKL